MDDTPAPVAQPLSAEPFWNRRWAVFEDEDHSWCVVTEDDAAEYVVWPEMTEADVRRVVNAHNTVLNVARMPEDAARSVPDNAELREALAVVIRKWFREPTDRMLDDFERVATNGSHLAAAPSGSSFTHENADPASPSGSSPVPAGLDVERLAIATRKAAMGPEIDNLANWKQYAIRVAREYAVLASPEDRTPEPAAEASDAD
jgi:hypothetical protein